MLDTIPFRVIVLAPPSGVHFAIQSGKDRLLAVQVSGVGDLRFEFSLRLQQGPDGLPNFLGDCAQGPRQGRFVYLTVGARAGQPGTCWDRRAKLPLRSIDWPLLDALEANPNMLIEGEFAGRARDGGPLCASVPVIGGWRTAAR